MEWPKKGGATRKKHEDRVRWRSVLRKKRVALKGRVTLVKQDWLNLSFVSRTGQEKLIGRGKSRTLPTKRKKCMDPSR